MPVMPPRRIQPELISAPGLLTTQQAFLTAAEVQSAEALAGGDFPLQLDFRQQAAMARRVLGPGRMLYVDLGEIGNEVDWRKVQGIARCVLRCRTLQRCACYVGLTDKTRFVLPCSS